MKLIEDNKKLADVCRVVEEKLKKFKCFCNMKVPVSLLDNFEQLAEEQKRPCIKDDYAGYSPSKNKIFVNDQTFFTLSLDAQIGVLAHEIGHAYFHQGFSDSQLKEILADFLLSNCELENELTISRKICKKEIYCEALKQWKNPLEYFEKMKEYFLKILRFGKA